MIHPQLLADCHLLGRLDQCHVLLHRNAGLPWFILVPETEVSDYLDLPPQQQAEVLAECAAVSRFIKQDLGFRKVNFAGLGNVVPQLHLHVIGRSEDDPCWPSPVWGALPEGPSYPSNMLTDWQSRLTDQTGMSPEAL